jgi:hypothetical protein
MIKSVGLSGEGRLWVYLFPFEFKSQFVSQFDKGEAWIFIRLSQQGVTWRMKQ